MQNIINLYIDKYYPEISLEDRDNLLHIISDVMANNISPNNYNLFLINLFSKSNVLKKFFNTDENLKPMNKNYNLCEERLLSFKNCKNTN